jgi:hypothetical protein
MKFHYKIVKHSISSSIFRWHLIAKNISGRLCHWPKYDHPKDFNKYNFSKNLFKALRKTSNVKGDDMKRQMGWPMGDSLCIFPCDVKRQMKNQYDEKSFSGKNDSNFIHQSVRQMSIGPFVGPSVKQVGIGSFIGPSVKQVRINNTLY